jgi:hypothetical protein
MTGHINDEEAYALFSGDMGQLAGLLRTYRLEGQATVVEEILASLATPKPDYERLAGIDMWGGSGAVWEVWLPISITSDEGQADHKLFLELIIRIAAAMDRLGNGAVSVYRRYLSRMARYRNV